ncbi:MAG: ATP-dependent DNA helicase [Candidatus Woesearchaeota archaeon]
MTNERLTKSQSTAVKYFANPLVIVAGPGSGKTKVLINKVKYLIESKKMEPSKIVLTTFTIKAAEELRKKIQNLIKTEDISSMFIGTIHSYCDNIIKQYGGTKNIPLDYSVLDDIQRYIFLRKHFKVLGLDKEELKLLKKPRSDGEQIGDVLRFYDELTENLADIPELLEYIKENKSELFENTEEKYDSAINLINSYEKYVELLKKYKLIDFAFLEKTTYNLLNDKAILESIRIKTEYVLIDEFQDINPLQWKLFSKIVEKDKKITVVGDKNQSIYGFRGANPNIFDKFKVEFKEAKQIELDVNFRSKKNIIDFGNDFLSGRETIKIKADRENEKTRIYMIDGDYESDSAERILELIKNLYKEKKIKKYGDVALLFRSVKNHGKKFIELLDKKFPGIPYSVSGGTNFLENEEIRSTIFFMSYLYGIEDEKISKTLISYDNFIDALDTELFKISKNTIKILKENPNLDTKNIANVNILTKKGISEKDAIKIISIHKLKNKNASKKLSIEETFYKFLSETECIVDYKKKISAMTKKMMFNLGYFSQLIQDYSTYYKKSNFKGFLYVLKDLPENLKLEGENDSFIADNPENLKLMTIHQAKGLEFPVVIIPSLVTRRFPNKMLTRNLIDLPEKFNLYEPYDRLKEEENLFYVAATRAQDSLILSKFKNHRTTRVSASEFVDRIEKNLVEIKKLEDYSEKIKERKIEDEGFHVIDYSSISTFIDCPERFNLRYIYGFVAGEIYVQKIGKIYHNALAKLNSNIKEKKKIDDKLIKEILDDSWITLKKDERQDEIMKKKFLREIKRYYQTMTNNELKKIKEIEKPIGLNVDNIRIRGRLDLLYENENGENVLMDFKSRKLDAIGETHVDKQLITYAMALEKEGWNINKLIAYPIQENNFKPVEGEISFGNDDKKKIKSSVKKFVGAVKNETFNTSEVKSGFCEKCPYKLICLYNKSRSLND